jgi:alkylated DNA repair dioxygenase AlkB
VTPSNEALAAPPVPGLTYLPDYLGPDEHDRLVATIDRQAWLTDLQRRVQHHGYRYDYKARKVARDFYLGPLPDWAAEVGARLHREGWFATPPDQLIVNEYQPGQGISRHVDCVPCFGPTVVSLSLGSTCVMELAEAKTKWKVPLLLAPRSAVVLQGEARYRWTHAVPARKRDAFGGQTYPRSRRLSLTFRTVLLDEGGADKP